MIDAQQKIGEMRREIEHLRRDFDAWKTAKTPGTQPRPAERTGFRAKFQSALADQLHHHHELFRIERRVSALEKHITELEQRCRPSVPVH